MDSPAEEATVTELAHLLVNPEILKVNHHEACHCSPSGTKTTLATGINDSECSYVYASPINGTPPDSDSSDIFFDPESSDTDKLKREVYFDPVITSDSDVTPDFRSSDAVTKTKIASSSSGRDMQTDREWSCDTSESETYSSRRNLTFPKDRQLPINWSGSNDSLNASSPSSSPSHESLWSTFDDSTVSLQESPSKVACPASIVDSHHIYIPKSHSDSELPNDFRTLTSGEQRDEVSVKSVEVIDNSRNDLRVDGDGSVGDENGDERAEATLLSVPEKTENIHVSDATNDRQVAYGSTVGIPDSHTLKFPATVDETANEPISKNEIKLHENNMRLLLTKLSTTSDAKEEGEEEQEEEEERDLSPEQETQSETLEEEEEEERPQRIRRSSSLKTGKTPPGTPGRKKIVRFADVLGLDLAAVRTFLDEIPRIPNSAYSDLIFQRDDVFQKDNSPVNAASSINNGYCDSYLDDGRRGSTSLPLSRKVDRLLVPLFQQPGGMTNFLDLVRERRVCLENVLVQDPVTLAIQGTVRVINLDFHKSVHIRYTLNSWRNFSDLQATYVSNSCDGFSDKFSFVLYCHTLPVGQRLEFAVRFQCKGSQYWDNNSGANYCFQCLPSSSPTGYIPITSESNKHTDWTPMFY